MDTQQHLQKNQGISCFQSYSMWQMTKTFRFITNFEISMWSFRVVGLFTNRTWQNWMRFSQKFYALRSWPTWRSKLGSPMVWFSSCLKCDIFFWHTPIWYVKQHWNLASYIPKLPKNTDVWWMVSKKKSVHDASRKKLFVLVMWRVILKTRLPIAMQEQVPRLQTQRLHYSLVHPPIHFFFID
jgi:hypothetical protein